jgi:NitT/TauT family transport system substrate-binding protein
MRLLLRLFVVVAFAALLPVRATAQSELTTVRLIASPVDDVMPVLYAQRAGLFRQAGLNVVIDKANNGGAVSAAVAGGAADIGKVNIGAIVTAHAHGVGLTIVAPAAVYDPKTPDSFLAVAANSPIRSARDLVGKIVGVPSVNELNTFAVQAWMEANHADWKQVKFVEIPFPAMIPALEAGRIQAATLVKPFTSQGVDTGRVRMLGLDFSAVSERFLESLWFADATWATNHRDTVLAFQRVVAQASTYTNAHQSETVDLLASWTGISPEQAARSPRIVTGTVPLPREIQPVIDICAKYGLIAKSFDAREVIFSAGR